MESHSDVCLRERFHHSSDRFYSRYSIFQASARTRGERRGETERDGERERGGEGGGEEIPFT